MEKMIAEFVKLKRKESNLTQKELANEIGISFRTIQNIESAENTRISTIQKVLKHFGYQIVTKLEIEKIN